MDREELKKNYEKAKEVRELILFRNNALVYMGWRLASPYLPNIDLLFWNTEYKIPYTYTV